MIQTLLGISVMSLTLIAVSAPQVRQVLETRICPGCDLSYTKLGIANLRGADLRGANLEGTDLKLTDLREANLIGATLYRADLRGADLTGALITNANLLEAKLCNTTMPDGQKSFESCPEKKPGNNPNNKDNLIKKDN